MTSAPKHVTMHQLRTELESKPLFRISSTYVKTLPRDKSDTLLLLAACATVLLPHFLHLAWWTSLICGGLMLWRAWITLRGQRLPPLWLLLPLAALTMSAVYLDYRTWFGRDTGVAMLTLLLTFKLLEMRARRDLFVVLLLSFFLLLTTFFYSQSILSLMWMIVTLVLLLTAQLSFQYTGNVPPLKQRLRLGGVILAMALPLTLILFLLFPRIQGPLWGLPGDAHGGRTGLSDSMAPGNISQLALSDDIAFRVKFTDAAPAPAKRYWRGVVLNDFDGRTWTQGQISRTSAEATGSVQPVSTPTPHRPDSEVQQQITLEPNGQRWLFALETPQLAPTLDGVMTRLTADHQIRAARPINERVRYDVVSNLGPTPSTPITARDRQQALALPPGFNPQTLQFALDLRKKWPDDAALVNAVLSFFRHENFSYTLEPPLLGKDSVDDFLFSSRAGFCEHYSSAFVVLIRATGIPARVVTGYQGGEINPVDNMMTVRQSDAHAWAEVWLPPRGWVRVDPTAAVAPNRIETQLGHLMPRSFFGDLLGASPGKDNWWSALNDSVALLRANWEALGNGWNQWVLNYTPARQMGFMHWLGFDELDWRTLCILMLTIGTVAAGSVTLPLLLARNKKNPLDTVYSSLCAQMARCGLARKKHEGPATYSRRLCASDSPLTPSVKIALQRFMALYETLQYGTDFGTGYGPHNKPPATFIAQLAQLKLLLSQCR
jgi:protein-glutamine gamma-glutamyltransferase